MRISKTREYPIYNDIQPHLRTIVSNRVRANEERWKKHLERIEDERQHSQSRSETRSKSYS